MCVGGAKHIQYTCLQQSDIDFSFLAPELSQRTEVFMSVGDACLVLFLHFKNIVTTSYIIQSVMSFQMFADFVVWCAQVQVLGYFLLLLNNAC